MRFSLLSQEEKVAYIVCCQCTSVAYLLALPPPFTNAEAGTKAGAACQDDYCSMVFL
jgi:hypothetical protein